MANGDFSAVLGTIEFDGATGNYPFAIRIDGGIFMIVYGNVATRGEIVTVNMAVDGIVAPAVVDRWTAFTMDFIEYPSILQVGPTIYAILALVGGTIVIYTVNVANNGTITPVLVDTRVVIAAGATEALGLRKFINVSGTTYAFVFDHNVNGITVGTVDIDAAGTLGALIASAVVEAAPSVQPFASIAPATGDYFVVVTRGPGNDGWAYSLTINGAGAIGAGVDSWEFDGVYAGEPEILQIADGVIAIVYEDNGGQTVLRTNTVSALGAFGAEVDNQTIAANGSTPSLTKAGGDVFIIASREDVSQDGFVYSVTISDAGVISAVLDTLEFETDFVHFIIPMSMVLHPDGATLGIAYQGPGGDGWFKSFKVEVNITFAPTVSTVAATEIRR